MGNTNVWQGRINDGEANRIASLPPVYPVGTTNSFIRPDGETNTISFDANSQMIIGVGGTTAMTFGTNKSARLAIGTAVNNNSYLTIGGAMRAGVVYDFDNTSFLIDPSTTSTISNLVVRGTGNALVATQGVSKIILPTSTNGLVPGTLWNDGGTVKVAP